MESNHPRAGRKSRKLGSRRRHQMKEVADEDGPPVLDSEQWPSQATEELQDFFRECGAEHKGFITREDLRKAKFSFLGNPEELELIFEWLDRERKGSLTIKEFTSGLKNVFSSQNKIPGSRKRKPRTWVFSKEEPTSFQPLEEVDPEERRWFLSFMEQLGTDHLLLDQAEIWQLWKKLRQEEPHLVGNLEGFLAKVTSRLQETQAEKETLQMTLKKYDDDHHREVRQLYEEMEHQIHSEKQRLQAASDTQGLAYSSMMHQALEAKEQEMQHLAEGQRELEAQIDLLKSKRHEVSRENQRLQETQRDLTGQLEQVQGQLQVTRGHLNLARGQVAWQVEEETSLSSDPPVDPKNTSDSQHFASFPEEDPLPSLFEEGDWSQLLSNFTSPLPGNTTQISWSPPPTPTSLKGYHTPRIVRQISITKRNSWQLNQESPSDPEVLPRSPLGSSEAPAVVPELNVAGELEPGKTFQWDFERVSSGEPATTTWGQGAPELGDFLASSDSLPSQGLAGTGKGFGETDGDEVGQGDGPISDLLSKGPSSEEPLQTLGPSTDMQADTWKVGAKEIPHPGLPPVVSEQEVGSWGKEGFTLGPDVPVETPELVLIQESIPMREKEQEKMNTEGWEIETNQQNDACDQETELRESAGPVVSEVPGEESKSTESPGPDVEEVPSEESRSAELPGPDGDEILGEGYRITESPGPDVDEVPGEDSRSAESPGADEGEVPGKDSRFTKSPGPDVENALSQKAGLTDSPGPEIGNPDAQETSHVESPRTVVNSVLSQEGQILRSLESDVEKVPGQKSQLIHLVRVIELPGTVIGNVTEKKSELIMSPREDTDNAFGQKAGVLELARVDVGNVLCEEAGTLQSAELERDNHPGQEIGLLSSPSPDVDVYPSYEARLLKSYHPGVGDTTELHRLTIRNASDHEARFRISPEIDASSQEAGLTRSPGPDEDDVSGQGTRFMESWKTDIKDASGKEAQVLYSPEPEVGETFRQENVFMSSLGPDRADVTGQKAGTGIGDAAIQDARITELYKDDVRNASDQGSGLMESPELHVDDTAGQENGFIQSNKTDMENISGQEVEILYSSGLDSSDAPGQGAGYIESPASDVIDVAVQEAGLMNSSGIDSADSPSQEDKLILPEKDVNLSATQESDVESGLDVGNSPSQEIRHDIGGTFLYSPGPVIEDALSQETRLTEPTRMDVDDATVQRPRVIELFKVDVGNVSDQENRLIKSSRIDAPMGKTELVELSGPEMGDALGQEVKFGGLCEMDVGDVEMAEIMYSPVPDMHDSPGQKSGVVSESPIQARILESDVRDGPGQEVITRESHEADVGNVSAQATEILHSPKSGVRDSGPYVGGSIGQKAGVTELVRPDVGNAPDQETRFMPSSETHVSDACEEEAEILHSPGLDEEDSPGQGGEPKESSMLDLEGTPGQEGNFLKLSEAGVDIGSSQQTRETRSPGPTVNEDPGHGQETGIRESYETDLRDALGNEVEFGPDVGDTATNEGILMLKTQQSNVSDAFNSGQVVDFIESCGPEVGDISHQEAEVMNSPGSDRNDAFHQETMFMELGETDVGNAEIAYSLVPDMSESLGQEVMTRESHEADVGNASAQDTEIMHSPRPGVRDSAGPKAEIMHSPGPYVGDSIGQEAGVPELDVGNAPGQEARFMPSSETHVSDACKEEAEILHSPGLDEEDSPGQGGEPKESSMLDLEGTPGQEAGIRESYETDLRDALGNEVEFGPDVGDTATNEGILMLKTQQSNVSDAFNSGQVVEFIELCGPEVGDISRQEAEIMNSPGSDRNDAFCQEAKFKRLGETIVGDAEMAEILYSAVPDVNDSPDQESGVVELRGLCMSEISIQQARVLESDVRDYAGQGIMTRESHEADVGNVSAQDTEIMHSPRPGVRDSGPYVGGSIGQEAGVPELDVGNAPDQEARFMPSSETHVSDACEEEAEILHSPGLDEEDSSGWEGEPKESSMLDLEGTPGQEGSFLELSEAGVDIGSSQQTRETKSPGPTVNEDPGHGQETGIRESYETDLRDALGNEVEFGPDVGDTATNEGILMLKTQQSNVSDAFNSGQVVDFIESCGPEVGDISRQEAEIMNSPGSDRYDAFHQETMFMELGETDVGNAEITYSLVPDMSESLGQEVMTRESHEADVGNASAQATEIMHSPRPGVRDSAGPKVELMHSPGPYVGDSIGQEAGVPELDVGNAPGQEARFMPSSETHVSDACKEEAEILHSPGLDEEDSPGQGGEPKESSMLDLEGTPGQEGSFLELSEAGVEDVFNHQVEQTGSLGSDVRDILGQEAEFKKSCERHEEDTLEFIKPVVLEETTSQEGSESPEEGVENGSRQQTGQIGSPGPDVEDAPGQEAEIRESYETNVRDALDKKGEFGPDVGDVAAGQGTLMPGTPEPDVGEASRIDQTTGFIELYGPEVGDISHQEVEIMNSPGSDRCDAFHQETMFMELGETDVGNAEIAYSPVPDMSESLGQEVRVLESPETDVKDGLGQEVMTRESHEADVGNASAQATEIMHSPRPGVRDSAGPKAEIMHSPGPYVGDSIGQEAGVPELDVGNAPDQEARFMPSPETHVSDVASQGAEILHLPGPDGQDSPGQEAGLSAPPVQVLEGAPIQESRFLELSEAGVHDQSCKQAGHPGSPAPGVRDTPVNETEILHTPNQVVSDYPHQGTDSLIESFRPVIDILSDEEVQLPESAGPRVGDAPEEKPGNVESPRPDVLPVVPERGGLQDRNSEAVWRGEDGVLQRQAQEGFLLPKDSSGDALGPQDLGQALSVPVEVEAQPECRVLEGQIIPLPEPREENSSEVMKKANLKSQVQATGVSPGGEVPEPDYLFHVLFLGDSNVGKTSFLHLLHHDSFATGLTATVGMDYRIKNLMVDNRRFALQLWDTAGQERYHSITKQFLRKADGIVLMYDVTCPGSFTHVRYWLDCIQESGPDDVVILLLGNKIDCVKERLVSTEVGQLLAKEIGVIFGECSAVLGHNILEPIVTLARAMQEQDTKLKHSVVKLEKKEAKKAGCCS
ncbi:ras-related protein Rab-44 isoform X2 [Sminthopsis crassicaudata]|uniref:ras-related protein Rab-44 isoform X2 n=1 Tax=Sminthopsis crassicaudata TaxID=9301 RepID=UPI003D6932E6